MDLKYCYLIFVLTLLICVFFFLAFVFFVLVYKVNIGIYQNIKFD